jgi:Flp pilus assembly protein TadG
MTLLARIRNRLRGEDGVAALEFAIVSMVFLVILYGILTYGFIFGLDQSINHAAQEAARSAISTTTPAAAIIKAEDTAMQRLSWLGSNIQSSDVVATVDPCPAPDTSWDCITVTITYPWEARPVVPKFVGLPTPSQMQAVAVIQLT